MLYCTSEYCWAQISLPWISSLQSDCKPRFFTVLLAMTVNMEVKGVWCLLACDNSIMNFFKVREQARTFTAAKVILSPLVILKSVLHDRPVIGLWWSDVCGGAQFTPGPLIVSAAAPSIAVRLLTECIRHGVSPKDTDSQSAQITLETGELN